MAAARDGSTRHNVAPDTGLPTWGPDAWGIHLGLAQISPGQASELMLPE